MAVNAPKVGEKERERERGSRICNSKSVGGGCAAGCGASMNPDPMLVHAMKRKIMDVHIVQTGVREENGGGRGRGRDSF